MKVAKEGYRFVITAAVFALVAFVLGWVYVAFGFGFVTLALLGFFRDPERNIPNGAGLIVSPADGKVVSIAEVKDRGVFSDAETRVSIFLSPVDVHINRSPVEGKVTKISYQKGAFLAAYKEAASRQNEQNGLQLIDRQGRAIGVVQIAGVLARRIVCRAKPGDALARGERFGLIMFGSRTDIYLPAGCRIEVVEGARVKGGETILGRFL
jgi:phosphatidylserine decarboxylase